MLGLTSTNYSKQRSKMVLMGYQSTFFFLFLKFKKKILEITMNYFYPLIY
jgi:hypothetical protein